MKKKLGLLFLFFIIFLLVVFIRGLAVQKEPNGNLQVLSSPSASVFFNNEALDKTPLNRSKLKEGEYLLKLIPEKVSTSTASWQGKIKIYNNTVTFVERELGATDLTSAGVILNTIKMTTKPEKGGTGEIEVESEPVGGIIFLDNDERAVAPDILTNVVEGEHELAVASPGFFKRTQKIKIEPGYRVVAAFKLAQDPAHKNVDQLVKEGIEATKSAALVKKIIIIKETSTGWLRVRQSPSLSASESAKVKPGEKYELLEEKNGWYKINYANGQEGWISSQYTNIEKIASDEASPKKQ